VTGEGLRISEKVGGGTSSNIVYHNQGRVDNKETVCVLFWGPQTGVDFCFIRKSAKQGDCGSKHSPGENRSVPRRLSKGGELNVSHLQLRKWAGNRPGEGQTRMVSTVNDVGLV